MFYLSFLLLEEYVGVLIFETSGDILSMFYRDNLDILHSIPLHIPYDPPPNMEYPIALRLLTPLVSLCQRDQIPQSENRVR